jgi:hypothetical protein
VLLRMLITISVHWRRSTHEHTTHEKKVLVCIGEDEDEREHTPTCLDTQIVTSHKVSSTLER